MAFIKKIIKSIEVAFSIYSKIPMPAFEWSSEDMKYHLCFFPWIGGVIGLVEWLWLELVIRFHIGQMPYVCMAMAIPLLITGGFHVDGFMDTMDAMHSYQNREKKLDILKDPHIGAFSVICLVTYMLIVGGCLSAITSKEALLITGFGFFMSRALSGISVMYFKPAKKSGMLSTESDTNGKNVVKISLILQLLLCFGISLYVSRVYGLVAMAMELLTFIYYWYMSRKQFGGITGDLAGFFVTVSELMVVMGVCITSYIL